MEAILGAPMIADPLGLYDCCGVSDGAACAIVTTPEIAHMLGKKDLVTIKAIQLSISSGVESTMSGWDGSFVPNTRKAAGRAYVEAGIDDPRKQLDLIERSEEHTSELQPLMRISYAVFCLKKKNNKLNCS